MRLRPSPWVGLLTGGLVRRRLPAGSSPRLLLTFDDGPSPDVTPGVLDRLEAHGSRALFFVIGQKAERDPDLLKRVAQAGHEVGNHSHTHPAGPLPGWGSYLADVSLCSGAIKQATGAPARYFRAPEGRLHPASLWGIRRMKMQHILWSLDSQDWRCTDSGAARASAEAVLSEVRDGDIILLHEFARWTWDLLDVLLPELVKRGFDLGTGLGALAGEKS